MLASHHTRLCWLLLLLVLSSFVSSAWSFREEPTNNNNNVDGRWPMDGWDVGQAVVFVSKSCKNPSKKQKQSGRRLGLVVLTVYISLCERLPAASSIIFCCCSSVLPWRFVRIEGECPCECSADLVTTFKKCPRPDSCSLRRLLPIVYRRKEMSP